MRKREDIGREFGQHRDAVQGTTPEMERQKLLFEVLCDIREQLGDLARLAKSASGEVD